MKPKTPRTDRLHHQMQTRDVERPFTWQARYSHLLTHARKLETELRKAREQLR